MQWRDHWDYTSLKGDPNPKREPTLWPFSGQVCRTIPHVGFRGQDQLEGRCEVYLDCPIYLGE